VYKVQLLIDQLINKFFKNKQGLLITEVLSAAPAKVKKWYEDYSDKLINDDKILYLLLSS